MKQEVDGGESILPTIPSSSFLNDDLCLGLSYVSLSIRQNPKT
jgi:hypothetical protein